MAGEWTTFRLGAVCSKIGSGATPRGGSSVYLDQGDVALIRSQNIYKDGFHHDGITYLREEHAAELASVEVGEHDVLLNITGDSVARSCQVDADVLPARVNQHVAIIRPDPAVLCPRFLRYFLVSPAMQAEMLSLAGAGATRNALTKGMIESFEVLAPTDVNEQRAIAHILGTLDDKIELNRRMNETLEAMARALFKSWFVDFDPVRAKHALSKIEGAEGRPSTSSGQAFLGLPQSIADLFPNSFEDSELGEIPKGWRNSAVGDHMVNFDSKRVPVSGGERAKRQGQYPYHGAAGVMDHVDDYLFDGIYLLIGEDGSVVQSNGMAVMQYVWGKLCVNNHAHVLQGKSPVSTEHLYLYFHFESVVPYVTGAVQPKLSQGRMNNMPFVFAGAGICLAFAKMVQPLFASRRANADMNATLAALRDTLLPKLISGELRTRYSGALAKEIM